MADRTNGAPPGHPHARVTGDSARWGPEAANHDRRTGVAVFLRGPSGHIHDANQRACRLLDTPADTLRGLAFHTFVGAAHRDQLATLDEDLRRGRNDHYRVVLPFGAADPAAPEGRRPHLLYASALLGGSVVLVDPVPAGSPAPAPAPAPTPLTGVEATLLELAAQGLTTAQIAKRLHYSDSTVNYHLAGLGARFGTNNRTALVSRAYVLGFLQVGAWPPRAARVAVS